MVEWLALHWLYSSYTHPLDGLRRVAGCAAYTGRNGRRRGRGVVV